MSCSALEDAGCDCTGCICPAAFTKTTSPNVVTRNITFEFAWKEQDGIDCGVINGSKLMSNVIHIGKHGKDYDVDVTPQDCKARCAQSPECGGFTYKKLRQFCRYKHRKPGKHYMSVKSKYSTCYIYGQPIADDSSVVGNKPMDVEEEEEALEWGFAVVGIIVVVVAVIAAVAAVVLVLLKRNLGRDEVVVRGLLVTDDV